ncbi:MAG TPA: hypothetical protein VES65_01460 [Solirubrobacteraceae bacterium]|nr:hypothetical protein [Solirubrobacteraceae bacterium]
MSPIVSPARPRERSHRLRLLRGHDEPHVDGLVPTELRRPRLRVVDDEPTAAPGVLLAGADPSRRAALRAELGATLTRRTAFAEADAAFEVLEQAPASRLVVLAGNLDDTSAESMMHLLARRHPQLPVISIEAAMPLPAAAEHG